MRMTVAVLAGAWVLVCLLAATSGCGPPGGGQVPHMGLRSGALAPLAGRGPSYVDPVAAAELIAITSALRELPFEEPVTISEVGDDGLQTMVTDMLASPLGRSVFVGDARTMAAFNTVSVAARVADHQLVASLSTEIGGYFDPNSRRVYVRRRAPGGCVMQWRTTVVHELLHALQHEHYGSFESDEENEDRWLASRALVEGDARVISLLYLTSQHELSRDEVLEMLASQTLLGKSVGSELDALPHPVRSRLYFEYWEGAAFVATLMRRGGMALIGRAFEQPPTTTEQVLHPTKYLAGEPAVELAPPVLPPGHQLVSEGTRGELLIRVMAERCLPSDRAEQVAAGWGGDAYRLARRDGRHVLLWRTIWDTPKDAQQFLAALAERPACWSASSDEGQLDGQGHLALRHGRQVALARGLSGQRLRSDVRRMLRGRVTAGARRPP